MYLIMIGIVISYFVGVTVNYASIASPIVLVKWVGAVVLHTGTAPEADALTRSATVTFLPILSVIGYGLAWRIYERFLKSREATSSLSLWVELLQVLFLGFTPLAFLEFGSPSVQLTGLPELVVLLQYGALLAGVAVISHFLIRTKKHLRKPKGGARPVNMPE